MSHAERVAAGVVRRCRCKGAGCRLCGGAGERVDSWDAFNLPTWFHDPNPPRDRNGKVVVDHPDYQPMWPIERIVEWARPDDRQLTFGGLVDDDIFAGKAEDHGCMRWGFCDTAGRLLEAPDAE